MSLKAGSGIVPSPERSSGFKIVFANQLRAVAALSVVLGHLGGLYVLMGPFVGWMTSSPAIQVGHPAILRLTMTSWLNLGAFGVAIFFLISGFVIPFSLRAQPAGPFLVARAFRIFPTLWAALLLEWLAVHAQSLHYGRPMAFPPLAYLYNALLADTALGKDYVDLVNWTLAIEVKFYIVMAMLRPWILRGRVLPLIGCSVLAVCVSAAQRFGLTHLAVALAEEPKCIGFMLIGTLFHYRLTGLLGPIKALASGAVLVCLFWFCWWVGPSRDVFPMIPANYLEGLAVFAACYAARGAFRPIRWLDFLAEISFPLYLIHSIIGYSAMTFLIVRFRLSYEAALPLGFAFVLSLAWLLHRSCEAPSMAFGKALARSLARRHRGQAAILPESGA